MIDPIIFYLAPVNYGENYDSTTGIYTVPMDGQHSTFKFTVTLMEIDVSIT